MFPLTRRQIIKILARVLFSRDVVAALNTFFPPAVTSPASQPTPQATKPLRFEYDAMASRMVKRSIAGFIVAALASSAFATGFVEVMDPINKLSKRIVGGDGIAITGNTISSTGIPAGGVSDATFKNYTGADRLTVTSFHNWTSIDGGRATNDRADFIQGQVTGQAAGAAAGATAVQLDSLGTAAFANLTSFATAAQGDKADTATQYRGKWLTSTAYVVGDAVSLRGNYFVCRQSHTSGSTNQPEYGISLSNNWNDYWYKGAGKTDTTMAVMANIAQIPMKTDYRAAQGVCTDGTNLFVVTDRDENFDLYDIVQKYDMDGNLVSESTITAPTDSGGRFMSFGSCSIADGVIYAPVYNINGGGPSPYESKVLTINPSTLAVTGTFDLPSGGVTEGIWKHTDGFYYTCYHDIKKVRKYSFNGSAFTQLAEYTLTSPTSMPYGYYQSLFEENDSWYLSAHGANVFDVGYTPGVDRYTFNGSAFTFQENIKAPSYGAGQSVYPYGGQYFWNDRPANRILVTSSISRNGYFPVTSVTSADGNATIADSTTKPVITIVSAPKLQTARTINGEPFDGTSDITIETGGTPGGVSRSIQYNNGGAFGGFGNYSSNGQVIITGATAAAGTPTVGLLGNGGNTARYLTRGITGDTPGYQGQIGIGTHAAPTAVGANVYTNFMSGSAHNGAEWVAGSTALLGFKTLGTQLHANTACTAASTPSACCTGAGTGTCVANQGAYITLETTPQNSVTRAERVRVHGSGGVSIGSTTDPGVGAILPVYYKETVKANGTCSTSINLDPTLGGMHTLTLNGACAIGVTNLAAGQSFAVKLTQSSTTAPTFTSAYKWPSATPPTWSTSATKYDVLSCYSDDGTALLCNGMVDVR
jgi:hypothetical protein